MLRAHWVTFGVTVVPPEAIGAPSSLHRSSEVGWVMDTRPDQLGPTRRRVQHEMLICTVPVRFARRNSRPASGKRQGEFYVGFWSRAAAAMR